MYKMLEKLYEIYSKRATMSVRELLKNLQVSLLKTLKYVSQILIFWSLTFEF